MIGRQSPGVPEVKKNPRQKPGVNGRLPTTNSTMADRSHRRSSPARPDRPYISRVLFSVRLFKPTLFTPNSGECLSNVGVDAFRVSE